MKARTAHWVTVTSRLSGTERESHQGCRRAERAVHQATDGLRGAVGCRRPDGAGEPVAYSRAQGMQVVTFTSEWSAQSTHLHVSLSRLCVCVATVWRLAAEDEIISTKLIVAVTWIMIFKSQVMWRARWLNRCGFVMYKTMVVREL